MNRKQRRFQERQERRLQKKVNIKIKSKEDWYFDKCESAGISKEFAIENEVVVYGFE